jgi:putative aldouronate transport system substrate-binding protein
VTSRCSKYVLIVLIGLLMMLTGCSEGLWSDQPNQAHESEHHAKVANQSIDGKTTTLTVALFDRNNKPNGAPAITDNFMTQYIQKEFGDPNHIKVEFVTIPRSEEVENLNVLMKANQAPDIVFTYLEPVVTNLVAQGALTDLTSLIDQFGDDLKLVLGEEVLKYGVYDGKQYAIPAKRVLRAQSTTMIREDWLQEVGLPLPETREEFYTALKAFKEKKPGEAGEDIIPYSLIDYYHMLPIQYSFWNWDEITDEDLYANPRWVMPGNKEAFRFLNKLYHEGLIDPNFAFDRDMKQFQEDFINGRIGATTPNTNEPVYMGYLAELKKHDPTAILTPIDPFTNANGKKAKPITEETGMYIMVPKFSKNAEAAVKYLNWMADPEHYITLQNGIEGLTYNMKDGIPITLENEDTKLMMYNYFDYCIILNGKFISPTNEQLNVKANAFDPQYEEFTVKSIEYAMKDGIDIPRIRTIIESEIKYMDVLTDKYDEIFVKVITAKPEQFDAVYDKEVEDYMAMGGEQVMNEKRIAYRAEQ